MHTPARPAALALALLLAPILAWSRPVHLATTVPIEKSRLLTQLLPKLRQATGLEVQLVAATPAQLTELARRGEVDVLLRRQFLLRENQHGVLPERVLDRRFVRGAERLRQIDVADLCNEAGGDGAHEDGHETLLDLSRKSTPWRRA